MRRQNATASTRRQNATATVYTAVRAVATENPALARLMVEVLELADVARLRVRHLVASAAAGDVGSTSVIPNVRHKDAFSHSPRPERIFDNLDDLRTTLAEIAQKDFV